MQRITISIDDTLAETFDTMVKARGYESRSEAVRDILRENVERWRTQDGETEYCVANLSYVYDRRVRALAERLSGLEHEHHDLVSSSSTVRLDHYNSLVAVVLKGRVGDVRTLADAVTAQRGVRFADLNLVAVSPGDAHDRPGSHHHHGHEHLSPLSS